MVIFTSICANYLHKARTLADSVKRHMPSAKFIVCLVERSAENAYLYPNFDEIILAKDAWEGNFERFIFKHSIVEASTAVKGQFLRYLYEAYPEETQFLYMDPDTYVYGDFAEMRQMLEKRPIVLCPHLLQPGNVEMELSSTAHGVYNLGFLAVSRSDEAKRFIDWWAERLSMYCYDDILHGIFTDQKWIDLAPCFFDVEVCKHRGYDFATWSLLGCGMTKENGAYFVGGDPLRFIHFSGYGSVIELRMKRWLPEGPHPFRELYEAYSEHHDRSDLDHISATAWSYAKFDSGLRISDRLRKRYRESERVMASVENPFAMSRGRLDKRIRQDEIRRTWAFWKLGSAKAIALLKDKGVSAVSKKVFSVLRRP